MIDEVDQRLKAWVGRIALDAPVHLGVPDREALERGVCLYLLELAPAPAARTGRRAPLQFSVCYLVTAGAASPEAAHRLLGELVFAAMQESEFEVDLAPVAAAVWAGLRVPPRPGFRLRIPVRKERQETAPRRAGFPVVVASAPDETFQGRVVGPGDEPIPGALVELPTLRLSTRTDARGCFRFPQVPPAAALGRLEVRARGELLAVGEEALATGTQPLLIRVPMKEDGPGC
ncbi:carboxypeptidase regulatory-like domain-containing protein [Corallococcus sp. H22C18031201]|uniref:carboxypeptidase-like regulatory domain-containing protein n=1 Tax=Citreicoccus inhibens TaxID=2849499 RepID=UPI000E73F32E|nr:carboxypeptidase-like regulatory domain-containing protein [Citreicoccus inhibens]MBU8895441.1 carboxypeptidase regulatory-like domain-containing protein [Citreicoccus inhibens]RJS22523.1 carboxypeptidase regulatory-like domain-containing protein [Corallococcus sp. H22C18031201]